MDSTDLPTPAPMFDGASVIVAGAGTAGASAARYLLSTGARVTVVDDRFADDPLPPVGSAVTGRLDDVRRRDLMLSLIHR